MSSSLNELKKNAFHAFIEDAGRVFVHVKPSDKVLIGKRGLLPEEKKNGIVLVFNNKMNFALDSHGISAKLVFGTTPEDCFVPLSEIIAVFSPELGAQLLVPDGFQAAGGQKQQSPPKEKEAEKKSETEGNLIKVDFRKK